MRRLAALLGCAAAFAALSPAARADGPEPVEAVPVTAYLELGDLDGAEAAALAALVRREFPAAHVELLEGTLRIQSDGVTFEGISRVLDRERGSLRTGPAAALKVEPAAPPVDPPAGGDADDDARKRDGKREGGRDGERKPARPAPRADEVRAHDPAQLEQALAELERATLRLRQQLAQAARERRGERPEVAALKEQLLVAEKAGEVLRHTLKLARREGAPAAEKHADVLILREGATEWRPERAPGPRVEVKPAGPDDRRARVQRLEEKLAVARKEGNEQLATELGRMLAHLRDGVVAVERRAIVFEDGAGRPLVLERRGAAGGEAAKEKPAPRRPEARERAEVKERAAPRPAEGGPLADLRRRLDHLRQAAEHLEAAGWHAHAKQVRAEIERERRVAEERLAAERAAEAGARALREKALREALQAQERAEDARRRAEKAPELAPLAEALRGLKRDVEALRKELAALRELVAKRP